LPYDGLNAFTMVAGLASTANIFAVHPSIPAKTLPELIALAKTRPGELAYGTNGRGRLTHLTGELLASRAGIKLQMVPYSGGTAQVLNDVMGKRIPLLFEAYSGIAGAISAGNVRPLAVAAPRRVAEFPDLPTVAETLPGFDYAGWIGIVAPVGTPAAAIQRFNRDLDAVLSDKDMAARLLAIGPITEGAGSVDQMNAFLNGEHMRWAKLTQDIGILPE
jgi:tripartite-type tricarboxylate transporter receptor subunit TctC